MNPADPRRGLIAGGNWIIDHVKIVDRYPAQDALASILSESRGTGGTPYNLLLNLAILGAPFPLEGIGLVGDDADGRFIRQDCAARGIDTAQLRVTKDAATSYTDVMTVQSTGRRTFFHLRGANARLAEEHFDLAASNARIFCLGYLLLLDTLDVVAPDGTTGASRLLARASALGFKTFVDAVSEDSDRFAAVVRPTLPHVDYLVINEFEASRCTGLPVVDAAGGVSASQVAAAARALLAAGVREWVVIHWPDGAVAVHRDGNEARHGSVLVPPADIAGAAGAGDAFAAGMLYGLHEGFDIRECLRIAVCAAAANLYDATCTGGMKPLAECLRLGEKLGFRSLMTCP